MNFKPILFSTEMVKAILSGIKVQTRRTKGLENINNHYFQSLVHHVTGKFTFVENGIYSPKHDDVIEVKFPYGQVGDVLWVREKIEADYETDDRVILTKYFADKLPVIYSTNDEYNGSVRHWTSNKKIIPSIHMPKEACRLFLKIKSIKLEKLQDISEQDAIDEGATYGRYLGLGIIGGSVREGYFELWEKINGKGTVLENPWVWVIEFERIEKPENFL